MLTRKGRYNATSKWKIMVDRTAMLAVTLLLYCCVEAQDIEMMRKQKPFKISGDIALNLIGYHAVGIPARQAASTSLLTMVGNASIYGIEMPFSFTYSDRDRSYAQPFNQFGISPRYKWATIHAGYRNINFSQFTLAGHTFVGGGLELTPGLLRFGFVYGRFDRSTTGVNPVIGGPEIAGFTRTGFAGKFGIGTKDNFFDLLYLRIGDDTNSVAKGVASKLPEQNAIGGFNSRFTFFKKLVWENEAALSLYTTDLRAVVPVDSAADPNLKTLNKFLVFNLSSEYYTAFRTSLLYREKFWSVKTEYKRIEPNYRSMGAYFIMSDVENITVAPSLILLKRKLIVSGSVGFQRDNVSGRKNATSLRDIYSFTSSYNPSSRFGIDIIYSNYGMSQKDGKVALNDTTRVYQTSQNVSVMPRLSFAGSKVVHTITSLYNLSDFDDNNRFTADYTRYTSHTVQLNYIVALKPSHWSFTTGVNYFALSNTFATVTGRGGTLGIIKTLLREKIYVNLNNSLVRTENTTEKGYVLNTNLITNYKMTAHHSTRVNIYFIGSYVDPGSFNKPFNETKGDIRYVYTF